MKYLLCLSAMVFCLFTPCVQSQHFEIHPISFDDASRSPIIGGMSNSGKVVGLQHNNGSGSCHFVWDLSHGKAFLPVNEPAGIPKINNNDQIVGVYWKKIPHGWFSSATKKKEIYLIDADGTFHDLGFPIRWKNEEVDANKTIFRVLEEISVLDVNDKGQILLGNHSLPGRSTEFAVWDGSQYRYLNGLNDAYEINNEGVVLGVKQVNTEEGTSKRLVLYNIENQSTLEILNHVGNAYASLNDRSAVIAVKKTESHTQMSFKGIFWTQETGAIELGDFIPFALNNNHQMVGYTPEGLALWDEGKLIPLPTLGEQVTLPLRFNDHGMILGRSVLGSTKLTTTNRGTNHDTFYLMIPN